MKKECNCFKARMLDAFFEKNIDKKAKLYTDLILENIAANNKVLKMIKEQKEAS